MDINMTDLVKQAQQFQQRLAQAQEQLGFKTVTASAGGGMVTVTVNGRQEVLEIQIERSVIDPDDPQLLQDLVRAAVNDAMRKAKATVQEEMVKLTGGINIPGLF